MPKSAPEVARPREPLVAAPNGEPLPLVAGFVVEGGRITDEVALVALTWRGRPEKRGWPAPQRFADVWAFAREALLEDTRDWSTEEGLERLLAGATAARSGRRRTR